MAVTHITIGKRYTLLAVVLIVAGMTLSNAIYYAKSREALLKTLSDQLVDQAETTVKLMDEAVSNIRLNFVYWSGDATLTTVVQEYLGEMVKDAAHAMVHKIQSDYQYYEELTVLDKDGVVISGSDHCELGADVQNKEYFENAVTGGFYISGVYTSDLSGAPVFTVSGPLYSEKEIVGVLRGVVRVSYFNAHYIKPIPTRYKGEAFMFRQDGVVIADSDSARVLSFNVHTAFPDLFKARDGNPLVYMTSKGVKRMVAVKTSSLTGWTVGVSAEKAALLKPISRLLYLNILVLLMVSLVIVSAVIWLVRTITRQLREIVKLKIAKEGAEAASRSKSEFLANMSHEIRTPMNAVLGFTDLLRSDIRDPKHKNYLDAVMISGKNLLRLINDILDLSKIEAGRLEIRSEPINLYTFFSEIEKIFQLEAANKCLELAVHVASDLPEVLVMDEIRLRQVLVNLVGNAVKFTERGRIAIVVERGGGAQNLLKKSTPVGLKISVADTGMGIPQESFGKIFESFSQLDDQGKKAYEGTGLGLAITRNLVWMMGGAISVKSVLGQGTTFEILFQNVMAAPGVEFAEEENLEVKSIVFSDASVLVVDDNEQNRLLMSARLQELKLQAYTAENGQEGVRCAKRYKPDLILMDIKMPVMDGYEALQHIRGDRALRHIPVVAVTASTMEAEKKRVVMSDFDGYLQKPLQKTALVRELVRLMPHAKRVDMNMDAVSVTESLSPKYPPEGPDADIPKVVELLERLSDDWRTARRTQYIPDMQKFSSRIEKIGEQYDVPAITQYARKLRTHIDCYDIEQMVAAMATFPQLIQVLRRVGEA